MSSYLNPYLDLGPIDLGNSRFVPIAVTEALQQASDLRRSEASS
jgi:hypothetical protein